MLLSMSEVLEMKEELRKYSLEDLTKKVKSLQSVKCRYGKIEKKKSEMELILEKERIVREVIIEKTERKNFIYERSKEEIDCMNMEEVMKGIKNIDSILCIENGKEDKFKNLEKIEKCNMVRGWLIERKEIVSGSSLGKVNISDVLRKIEDCKNLEDLKVWLEEKSKQIIQWWVGGKERSIMEILSIEELEWIVWWLGCYIENGVGDVNGNEEEIKKLSEKFENELRGRQYMKKWEEWKDELYIDGNIKKEYDSSVIVNLEELNIKWLMYLNKEIDEKELEEEINFVKYRFGRIRKSK